MRQSEKGRARQEDREGELGWESEWGVGEGGVCVRCFMMKNEGCAACAWRRL